MDDKLAWHYEKTGCFTVRSAYRLGMQIRDLEHGLQGSSSRPDGARMIWKKFWALPIPQKVKIFAWRLIHKGLATRDNKHARRLEEQNICEVCGMEVEDEHHAVIRCNLATSLRTEMRKVWLLPGEEALVNTGPEWLLELIDNLDGQWAGRLLLLLWRSWFNRNEVTHGKTVSLLGSVKFLTDYSDKLFAIQQQGVTDVKGKKPVHPMLISRRDGPRRKEKHSWEPPKPGWLKVNVDGSYTEATGTAGLGVVIWDHQGDVKLSAWRVISRAIDAEEVEAMVYREGLNLAAEWFRMPIVLESDCVMVIRYLKKWRTLKPACFSTIQEAVRTAESLPDLELCHVKRERNGVANELAHLAKWLNHSAVWCDRFPRCVEQIIAHDCNSFLSN